MNFDDALQAHAQWKLRLSLYISGSSNEQLDPTTIGADNKCALGQWIYGDGSKYSSHTEYSDIVSKHKEFHKAAARVIHLVQVGQSDQAKAELEPTGNFYKTSLDTITAIKKLRDKVQ